MWCLLNYFSRNLVKLKNQSMTAFHSTKSREKFAKEVWFSLQESVYKLDITWRLGFHWFINPIHFRVDLLVWSFNASVVPVIEAQFRCSKILRIVRSRTCFQLFHVRQIWRKKFTAIKLIAEQFAKFAASRLDYSTA